MKGAKKSLNSKQVFLPFASQQHSSFSLNLSLHLEENAKKGNKAGDFGAIGFNNPQSHVSLVPYVEPPALCIQGQNIRVLGTCSILDPKPRKMVWME